jgi:hypothetical protein
MKIKEIMESNIVVLNVKKWIKKIFVFAKPSVLKPISWAISSLVFILLFLFLLNILLPKFNLYVSFRDSIVSLAKSVNIEVKKKNNLILKIGHSDSEKGLQDDNYKVTISDISEYVGVWFAIYNPESEDTYKNVKLFIVFQDKEKKIDGKDSGNGKWTKFQDSHFNYGLISEIGPGIITPTNSINFRFPQHGNYTFHYAIYADGYKPITGVKSIIIEK